MEWNIRLILNIFMILQKKMKTKSEKERLEQYFQTVVKNLPGGVAVVHYEEDGHMVPEFLSDGFAEMTGMSLDEAWELYEKDAMSGVHPDDWEHVKEQMRAYITSDDNRCEIVYRLRKGTDSYVWVKNTLTLFPSEGGGSRVYAVYHEMTKEREEKGAASQAISRIDYEPLSYAGAECAYYRTLQYYPKHDFRCD